MDDAPFGEKGGRMRASHLGKSCRSLICIALIACMSVATHAAAWTSSDDQPLPLGHARPSAATVQAWKDRKFGMFIHFGLFSVAGGMWHGKRIDHGYSEQIVANGNIPMADYAALASTFDPLKFDADAIVELARQAGMKFIVLTAKHHDGFNLFRTAQTRYNVVDATPYKRDVVKELAGACARAGMPFGVYYSTIDWHHPGGNTYIESNSNPITPAQADFNVAQIRELMSHYGRIAEIWFDMGKPTPAQSARFAQTVHALQPQTMVSGRVWNYQGDFTVMDDNREPDVAVEEPWQSPASMFPETWGYRSWQRRDDVQGKIRENIARLVRVVSAGGNYILNIGPRGDGSVVPYEADVLRGVGQWLKTNGVAIYGSQAQPFARLDFGYATVGDHALYLFIDKPPADGLLHLPGVVDSHLQAGRMLGDTSGRELPVRVDAAGAMVDMRALHVDAQRGPFMPVIAVPIDGALHVRPDAVTAGADGVVQLAAERAEHFLNYNGYGYEDPSTLYKLRWHAALGAGRYRLRLHYIGADRPARLDLLVDGARQTLVLPAGKGNALERDVEIERDLHKQPYAMQVELTPVEPFHKGDRLPVVVQGVEIRR
jgi:alpha-L-fucosidase